MSTAFRHPNGRNAIQSALLVLFVAGSGLVLHEVGHGLSALAFGERITDVRIFPGIRLYPAVTWGGWDANVAVLNFSLQKVSDCQYGIIKLMGCGLTTLTGYFAALVWLLVKPKGWTQRLVLLYALLLPLDMITYAAFPALGLRHWIFVGGQEAEPLAGAELMGIKALQFYLALVLVNSVFYDVGIRLLVRRRGSDRRRERQVT